MKKRGIIILCVAAAVAVAAVLCVRFLGGGASDDGNVVYVNTVEKLMSLGSGNGMQNRFSGVVEAQETWSVQQNSEKTVKEILVSVGDEVAAGTPLFTYDTEQYQSDLAQAQIDLERINNEISSINSEIATLEKEKKSADSSAQAAYTLQISEQQLIVKQKQYDAQAKQLEIDKLNENINNATVTSEIDGVVKSINSDSSADSYSSDTSFITVMKTGDFRIKGRINEQNIGAIVEGEAVIVYSRADESKTWTGTVSKIDMENTDNTTSNYYVYSSDDTTSSSSYPFYIELDDSSDLMMGQHVYIEVDNGQSEEKTGVWLDSYYIDESGDAPFVWADNGSGKLEKREVELGQYDESLMQYEIISGLSEEDKITFPEDGLTEGMTTAISSEGMLGQSDPATDGGGDDGEQDVTDGSDEALTDGTEEEIVYDAATEDVGASEDAG